MTRNFEPWDRETIAHVIESSFRPYPNSMIGTMLCQVYDELLAAEAMVALLQARLVEMQPTASAVSGWVSDDTNPPTTLTVTPGDLAPIWVDTDGNLHVADRMLKP
ncbi:MAG: hypothetical protein U0X20_31770 [Caldilineaceae bacterium]